MSWYTTGSVNLTNGSKSVTGVGTKWTNPLIGICAGQMMILKTTDTIEICEIASVQSDTQLTLANKYEGVTKTGVNYEIPTVPNISIENLALRVSEMLNYYQQQMEGWQTVLTGEGEVTLTAPDGRSVTIKSQYSIQSELIKLVEKGKNFSETAIKNAELSNNACQSAKNSESSAKTSADNAAKFADSANQSANNAGNSATSAKTAETSAKTLATEAKQSALDAKNWASTVDTSTFVKKSGDTMTGNLTISNSDSSAVSLKNNKNEEWMLRIHLDGSFSIFNKNRDGKWTSRFRNESTTNTWRFENTSDVTIGGKSALKVGDGGLLSYTQTINDVFAPEITTGFYRWDGNSINTPYKGLGYFNKISWNANESTVLAHGYNTNRLFIGYKHKSTGDVKFDEILKFGDYGVGAPTGTPAQNLDEHLNSGFYGTNTAKIPNLPFTGGGSASSLLVLPSESPYWKVEQLSVVNGRTPRIYYRTDTKNDGKQAWYEAITTANVGEYTHPFKGDLANKSLNDLTGTVAGNYFQGRNASAAISGNNYPIGEAGDLIVKKNGADGAGCSQIYTTYRNARQFIRNYRGGTKTWEPWVEQITTANSTVDSNGFYKKSSPILRLYGTEDIELIAGFTIAGCGLVNDLATGVIATRISVGHYEIRGSLGFATEGWYIQLPEDANGNKKFFAEYSADENGIITIKTYTKKFDTKSCEIVAGEPIDITGGRWIDVRLEMPVTEEVQSTDDFNSRECLDNRSTNEIL